MIKGILLKRHNACQTDHIHITKEWNLWPENVKLRKDKIYIKKTLLTVAGPSDGTQSAEQQLLALHGAAHPKHEGSPDAPEHSETCFLCSGL